MQKLVRLPEVIERTSLSRSTIYEMMAQGRFPRPVKLNLRSNGWVEGEINDWLASRVAEREAA
jgi:prophage regulatory protein